MRLYRTIGLVSLVFLVAACQRPVQEGQVSQGDEARASAASLSSSSTRGARESAPQLSESSSEPQPSPDQSLEAVAESSAQLVSSVSELAVAEQSSPVVSPASPEVSQPTRVLLSVTPQIQQVWHYCAPTTVSMMLSARGLSVSQSQLAQEMGTYEPFGTHNRDAIRVLNQHLFGLESPAEGQAGYRLATVTDANSLSQDMVLFKQRLRQNIQDGYPLYYTIDVSKIYPGLTGEHNVIGIGYELTPDGQDLAALYYLDPSPNVQDPVHGGLKKVTPEQLLTAMLTCSEPNYAW